MSNIYLNEPPTSGKVLLHTSVGDIDIELWAKEAPLACRNFIQLSMEGYYDGTLFHRVIKDFMAQGGDPTNSGKGGASSWGRPFKDEIHGRIKFNHRGQLAMANENKPNTNQSQFFLTLGDCEWLNRKHTIFGKVTGNTIFNLLRMSEVECGDDERPIDDIILKSVEVLWNPFDDIIPRNVKRETGASDGPNSMSSIVNKKRRKGKKDLKLLSFADDDTEVEHDSYSKKMISAHDAETRGCVDNSKLSSEVDPSLKNLPVDTSEPAERDTKITNKRKIMASTIYSNDSEPESPAVGSKSQQTLGVIEVDDRSTVEDGTLPLIDHDVARNVKLDNKSAELLAIKKDIMRSRRAVKVMTGEEAVKHRDDAALRDFVTPLERQRQRFLKRKREHGDREQETLSKLMQFSSNLKTQKKEFNPADTDDMQGCNSEVYHGQILVRDDDDDDKAIGTTWHVGKLKFRKHIDDAYRIGSDGKKLQDYTVIDPR